MTNIFRAEADEVARLERREEFIGFERFIMRSSYEFGGVMKLLHEDATKIKNLEMKTRSQIDKRMLDLCGNDQEAQKLYKMELIKERIKEDKKLDQDKQRFAYFLDSKIGNEVRRLLKETDYHEKMASMP